jgi:hypothetical protein
MGYDTIYIYMIFLCLETADTHQMAIEIGENYD